MNAKEKGHSQQTSAAKAGISRRTASRIENGTHRPKRGRPRDWQTRQDPLNGHWEAELLPMLEREPRLAPITLFEALQELYPGAYDDKIRTVERRVKDWKAQHGKPKEVMFKIQHSPGVMGLSDFTHLKGVTVTVKGQPFQHILYHYRLAFSGWQYVQVIQGGESFVSLSQGLQNALFACGGVPKQHRTDSLSAAYRNTGGRNPQLTQMYAAICDHYRMQPTRNNPGVAHENGSIESSHGYFKRRLCQALYRRGRFEFESVAQYQAFIESVIAKLNAKCAQKFEVERSTLQSLPRYRTADYEILSSRVSVHSTISIRCILYSVPSRLIGQQLTLHLYHDQIVGFVGATQVVELPRLHVHGSATIRRARCINYRHMVESLRRKPRAFLHCQWQEDLLPDADWRDLWQQMKNCTDPDTAARWMVEALYIAATQDREVAVASYLKTELAASTFTLARLQHQFNLMKSLPIPEVASVQHELSSYDQLFQPQSPSPVESLRDSDDGTQTPQAQPLPVRLAERRTPSHPGELELRSIPPGTGRRGSQSARPSPDCPRAHRSAIALRKILV
jgi:transcriptional regulator with XRE-family HTH domain